jgi:hypothetical protein
MQISILARLLAKRPSEIPLRFLDLVKETKSHAFKLISQMYCFLSGFIDF